jgi:hypothetical protein
MAKLTAADRKKIPTKDFALPGRKEPIKDKSHAKAALTMGMRDKSSSQKATIRAAVHRKFPELGNGAEKKKTGARPREGSGMKHEAHHAIGSHEGRTLGFKK